jgi:hypothetical protein
LDVLVLQDRPAMDGVLKFFELRLQMPHPRFERLNAVVPIDLWRPVA